MKVVFPYLFPVSLKSDMFEKTNLERVGINRELKSRLKISTLLVDLCGKLILIVLDN